MKKMFSLALALILALALCVPAFATGTSETTQLTITSENNSDAAYEGYRLLQLTSALKCKDANHTHDTKGCYNYSYKINGKYETVLKNVLKISGPDENKTLDQTVMDMIAAKSTAADIRAFAEDVVDAIVDAGLEKDVTLAQGTPAPLTQGYWLIVDVTANDKVEEGVSRSLVMLDTAGEPNLTIAAKDDKELLEKTVNDDDVKIGQDVTFTLKYTLPAKLDEYVTYTFKIKDTLSAGLTFKTAADTYSIKIGDTNVDSVQPAFDGQVMTIDLGAHIFGNKNTYANQEVVITYQATVNDNAVISNKEDNKNTAVLTYTNDPSNNSTGETDDSVSVSTYAIALKKVDIAGNPLANADFQFPFYVKSVADEDGAYIYAGTTAADGLTNVLTTPADGVITVKGVDSGNYTITEIKAPDGYNLLANPVTISAKELTATASSTSKTFYLDADGNEVPEGSSNIANTTTYTNSHFYADTIVVVNKTGTELPSTGGIGTTIFYTVGGLLMAGAAILLVTKKKLANEQ